MDNIDKALAEVKYYGWDIIHDFLYRVADLKAARKGWDNVTNQEYIEHDPRGFVKHYRTVSLDGYFKNVEHSYRPTDEDKEAKDWFII